MDAAWVRAVTGLILIGHGLGHALAVFPIFGLRLSETHSPDSFPLSRLIGAGPARGAGAILNLLALLAFVGAGLALPDWALSGASWGRLAVVAAVVSCVALTLYWNAFPFLFPNKVGVITVNAGTLLSVIWLRWPPELFGG